MEPESLLQNTRWQILESLSRSPKSASEIAKELKSSIANVSQQIQLLEAYQYVQEGKLQRGKPGKPRQQYRLKRPLARLVMIGPGMAQKRSFTPESFQMLLLQTLFLTRFDDQQYLSKLFCMHEEIADLCSVAFLSSNEKEIHVLYVTEHVEDVRKKYSSLKIGIRGVDRKIAAWTHSIEEINEGLALANQYFADLMRNSTVLHDPDGRFAKIRGEGGNT